MLQLRSEVFVVEQNCVYQDLDGLDFSADHLLAWNDDRTALEGYLRVTKPGVRFPEFSIGRVVTAKSSRGKKLGKALMVHALKVLEEREGSVPIRISAQSYLEKFYQELGFRRTPKEPYREDDIPHIEMLKV